MKVNHATKRQPHVKQGVGWLGRVGMDNGLEKSQLGIMGERAGGGSPERSHIGAKSESVVGRRVSGSEKEGRGRL